MQASHPDYRVKVLHGGQTVCKTKIKRDTAQPQWNKACALFKAQDKATVQFVFEEQFSLVVYTRETEMARMEYQLDDAVAPACTASAQTDVTLSLKENVGREFIFSYCMQCQATTPAAGTTLRMPSVASVSDTTQALSAQTRAKTATPPWPQPQATPPPTPLPRTISMTTSNYWTGATRTSTMRQPAKPPDTVDTTVSALPPNEGTCL